MEQAVELARINRLSIEQIRNDWFTRESKRGSVPRCSMHFKVAAMTQTALPTNVGKAATFNWSISLGLSPDVVGTLVD